MKLSQIELYLSELTQKSFSKDQTWKKHRFERMRCILDLLQNPEKKIPHYIHITGTSGKGSVAIMLATILKTAGYKTGLLISPHPSTITERWQINNRPMSKGTFEKLFTQIYTQLQKYEHSTAYQKFGRISYGELMTIIGLYYFAQEQVTWAVIEVSVGGRGDSTNIIPYKDVAVITTIGIDHTKTLGRTKAAIAQEKLGILHPQIPLFTAEKDKKILEKIHQECKKQKSFLHTPNLSYQLISSNLTGLDFKYQGIHYHLSVLGYHQITNAILSITIARYLKLPEHTIEQALQKIILPLRMEVVSKQPLIILDSAHNRDKIKSTVETLLPPLTQGRLGEVAIQHIYILLATANRRDLIMKLKPLIKLHPKKIVLTQTISTLSPNLFLPTIKKLFPNIEIHIDLNYQQAFSSLKKELQPQDILLVTGSVYLSGALRKIKTSLI
jgi:dihydrofolate synthase/folylpolyglutamate synthase